MTFDNSMFLVEIIVEELKSYVNCRDFIVKCQFADVFSIILKDPNALEKKKLPLSRGKRKILRRNQRPLFNQPSLEARPQMGRSVSFTSNIEDLKSNMRKYPIELSLWSKLYPEFKLASTNIPWHMNFVYFLTKLQTNQDQPTMVRRKLYNVFDEFTSRRMAAVILTIKLSCISNISTTFRSLSEDTVESCVHKDFGTNPLAVNKPTQIVPYYFPEDTGTIKTIYSGGKKPKKSVKKRQRDHSKIKETPNEQISEPKMKAEEVKSNKKVNSSLLSLVKSQSDIDKNKRLDIVRSKSCSSMYHDHLNILNYIFGDRSGPFGNQVYCVGYVTVQKNDSNSATSKISDKESSKASSPSSKEKVSTLPEEKIIIKDSPSSKEEVSTLPEEKIIIKVCDNKCLKIAEKTDSVDLNTYTVDLPKKVQDFTSFNKCKAIKCDHRTFKEPPSPPDERILLDLTNLNKNCCEEGLAAKVEKVFGGMKAKMKIGEIDPCYCECECVFGFVKKTTYCKVCQGYEVMGDDLVEKRDIDMPFPCPVYHNLLDKPKVKSSTTEYKRGKSRSETKETKEKTDTSDIESKKGQKKKKKDDKFKFNYGYKAAKIGHCNCGLPCSGVIHPIPKRMGWLWTSDDVPGLKFRPGWKPGAVNKHVVRQLKIAKNPEEAFAKKKRKKVTGKPKRPLKRPLLTVHKKDGEYTVCLETMKSYNRPRAINQAPYEDKDPIVYTVGRTDEENYERRKKKERIQRRLEREQREFIQSAFKDMCEEICLKTYQQALGILPDAEIPDCKCYPAEPGADRTDLDHSCSCSEDSQLSFSDTDSDEWIIEVTPPIATFNQTYKTKKVTLTDSGTQYTYLDYRVKLLDKYGNPVPRFFIGPDGKQECSDLGGFWNADHSDWLEINIDGYIGPDGKWAPLNFVGPDGEPVEAEMGKFQISDGTWLVVGIDGYVDNGHWRYYFKKTDGKKTDKGKTKGKSEKQTNIKKKEAAPKKSETMWSCFGDVSAKYLSEMGIVGHGHDRKILLDTLKQLIKDGENVKMPKLYSIPQSTRKKPYKKRQHYYHDNTKCTHATPSRKGVIAVDGHGNKIYFRLKDPRNLRPKHRFAALTDQGISISSFHVPCFHSFIKNEMKAQQRSGTRTESERRHYRGTLS